MGKKDDLLGWASIVNEGTKEKEKEEEDLPVSLSLSASAELCRSSVCCHWSLKYNQVAQKNGGDDASFDKFHSFLRQAAGGNNVVDEVLLISGSGEKGKKSLDAVDALERLQ